MSLLDTYFGGRSFVPCINDSLVNLTNVNQTFDYNTNTYQLIMEGYVSGTNFPSVASTGIETSIVEISFWPTIHQERFSCGEHLECFGHGSIRFEKKFVIPDISFPLADIASQYQIMIESTPVVCFTVAPIGYQNQRWQRVFTYIPLSVAMLAGLVSLIHIVQTRDIARIVLEYVMDSHTARLVRSSSIIDVVDYVQFAMQSGIMNLKYPHFYPLFTADFSWSWLLFQSRWLAEIVARHKDVGTRSGPPVMMDTLASALHMDAHGMFMTALIVACLITAALVFLFAIYGMVISLLAHMDPYRCDVRRSQVVNTFIGVLMRFALLCYVPMVALAFYQLMLPSPWYLLVIATVLLVAVLFGFYRLAVFIIGGPPYMFIDVQTLLRYGGLFSALQPSTSYFVVIFLVHRLLSGAMIGLFQMSGEAQITVMVLLEVSVFCFHLMQPPFRDRIMNFIVTTVAGFRACVTVISLCYVTSLGLSDRKRLYAAYTQICIHYVVFILFLGIHIARLVMLIDLWRGERKTPSEGSLPPTPAESSPRMTTPMGDGQHYLMPHEEGQSIR